MTDVVARLRTEDLNAGEIADALWLAGLAAAAARARPPAPPVPEPPRTPPAPKPPPPGPPDPPPPAPATDTGEEPPPPVVPKPPPVPRGRPVRPALRFVAVPGVRERPSCPELPPGLEKALRPFDKYVRSMRDKELDEESTAVAAAESGLWVPVQRPRREHPFEIVLVVDGSASMRIWGRTATAVRLMLERQGVFRDVRVVRVDTDRENGLRLETAPGAVHPPGVLTDPTGRRVVLVLTDGVGRAWRSGAMFELLTAWARTCRVAVAHLLPTERWDWTGIRVEPRTLPRVAPGIAGPVPVLALEHRYLGRWAALIGGAAGIRLPVLLPPSEEDTGEPAAEDVVPAEERVRRFQATATPNAMRLAVLLAAVPLTLHMIEAVRGTFMPAAPRWHLAEVQLGRLLRSVPAPRGKPSRPVVEWDFRPGLRRVLLAMSTRDETAEALRLTEDVLGPEVPALAELRRLLKSPERVNFPGEVPPGSVRFFSALRDALSALSGPYTRLADRLAMAMDEDGKTGGGTGAAATAAPGVTQAAGEPIKSAASTLPPSRGIPSVTTTSPELGTEVRRSTGQPAVWGGVPLRNVNFIGRRELLKSLHEELSRSTTTAVLPGALHGMGGIGKSQIAVEFVYRHAEDYDLIWWIPSENPSEIQASLVKLAKRLELPVEQSVDTAVPAVLEALRTGHQFRRWLLVFDNADRPEQVRDFWPRGGEGHILVTSRNPQWSEVAQAVEVEVFRREESRELLQRRNVDLVDTEADRLADVLGDLPLAVEQAAAWRAETGMATDEYLRLFDEKRTELLESRPPADYEVAVEAAWNVSLDRLRVENPGALELLEVCAFFSPEPISRALFSGVRNIPVSEALERTLADPIRLGRAIREITRYSLAKIDHRSDTLQLHRLVQVVLRNKLSPDDQVRVRHTAHLLLANRDPKKPDSVEYWPRYAELLPHIRAVDAVNCTDEWVRRMAINAVIYLFAFGDPAGALEMARDFARFWGEKLGEDHQDTLVVSRWWGRTLRALGRFEEGREVAQRTLDRMRATLGETHEETLLTMHGVASGLRAAGEFAQAKEMNEFAYRSAVARFGEDDPDTLAAANNYALSLRLVGDFTAARDLDERTWKRKRIVLGEDHRHTLLTLDNWSVDLRETGDYLGARREQDDTVRRMREQLGDRHPMTLAAIKNLAVAWRKAGQHDDKQALTLALEATDGFVSRYGEAHPDAMSAALELSIDHRQDGNLKEARRLGEHVKDLYEATWGARHPFSMVAATNLAVTLRQLNAVAEARALNEQALAGMRETLGEDHPFTLVCATNYASDLAASGEHEKAYALDQETLERSVRVLGEDHPSSLALVVNQALDLRELNRGDEADSLQLNVVQRLSRVLGPRHPATKDAQLNHRANCDIDTMQI
ncbi:FxSxx-COOH system tetratricopeptide repeat protein [Amycolatopsis sp. NPDC058278]|uniref:FxSxx-COOH system tetratricopeptide repeat protein n=1 Tax=Amycolatopsis sp. NPDC058278 TaxID=3346417 RepID=UPI0036DDA00B